MSCLHKVHKSVEIKNEPRDLLTNVNNGKQVQCNLYKWGLYKWGTSLSGEILFHILSFPF